VPTSAHHHVAVRVADLDRSLAFYRDALDARVLARPFTLEGPDMERIFGGHPGLRVRICLLGFEEGGGLELFQFLEPAHPTAPTDQTTGAIVHFGLQVDSVRDSLARVEAAGGGADHDVLQWGGRDIVYCRDPDGNLFELVETPFAENVRLTLEVVPDAAP